MQRKNNPELYLQRKRAFVGAAAELIKTQSFSSISIRKIAETAGFHNSTIYSYFQDADWLLALASVRYLQPYSDDLLNLKHQELPPCEYFYAIWECFCRHAFANPSLYYNFFFGKYRNHLTELLEEYYELFPESQNEHPPLLNDMFLGSNMHDRCLSILKPLCGDPETRLTEDNLLMSDFIIVSSLEELLAILSHSQEGDLIDDFSYANFYYDKNWKETFDTTKEYLKMLHFIIDQ